ncbi:MAG: redoxin domain-containing protein [Caldilineaceae bacterium]|nr:redoxin domain-containing protein [Caldilineaceae bacterium]
MAHLASPPFRVNPRSAIAATLLPLLVLGGLWLLLSQRPSEGISQTGSAPSTPAAMQLPSGPTPLAVVNGTDITSRALADAQAIDRAMGHLLGVAIPTDAQAVLERLVNGLLVTQAAQQASFSLTDAQVDTALANFLAGAGQDIPALENALAGENVNQADFRAAFAQLLLVDQFTRQQAAAQGMTASDYLHSLQKEAHISFGPDVESLTQAAAPRPAEQPVSVASPSEAQPPAETQPTADPATLGREWQLLPFVADPAFATPNEENVPALEGTSSAGSVEQIVTGTATGNFAPDFRAALAKGDGALTLADLKGKPTLLSFWTTWCPYCLRQTPLLVDAHNRWAEAGVNFVGINVGEASAQVLPYLETHAIDYPVGLDENSEIAAAYAVRGFPTTYFLDAEGRVIARHVGQLSAEDIDSYLNQITQK